MKKGHISNLFICTYFEYTLHLNEHFRPSLMLNIAKYTRVNLRSGLTCYVCLSTQYPHIFFCLHLLWWNSTLVQAICGTHWITVFLLCYKQFLSFLQSFANLGKHHTTNCNSRKKCCKIILGNIKYLTHYQLSSTFHNQIP